MSLFDHIKKKPDAEEQPKPYQPAAVNPESNTINPVSPINGLFAQRLSISRLNLRRLKTSRSPAFL